MAVDLKITDTTLLMLPPQTLDYDRVVFNERAYDAVQGVPVHVLAFDVPILQSRGWTIVLQAASLSPLTLSSNNFAVGVPAGTIVGTILGTIPGSTVTFDSLSVPGALQIVGTSLQVGPTAPSVASIITFNLVETFSGAVNSPHQTNGFSVNGVAILPVPANLERPVITGTAQEGQTLSSSTGTWSDNPTSFAYQWNRDGVAISGAAAAVYTIMTADVGAMLTVTVFAANSSGTSAPSTSLPTSTVIALPAPTPVPENGTPLVRFVRMYATLLGPNTGYSIWEFEAYSPSSQATNVLLNKPFEESSFFDATLHGDKALDGNKTTTRWASEFNSTNIQWLQVNLPTEATINEVIVRWQSAYAAEYRIDTSNDGVTWDTIWSATSGAGGDVTFTQRPAISGTAEAGQTLTATPGTWTNTPTSYNYQWYRGTSLISGANAPTYVIASPDVGSPISVSVVAGNAGGSSIPVFSAPTAVVAAVVAPQFGLPTIFALGLKSSMVNGWWMPATGIPWNYRYQYLNAGWENWNSPSGAIVTLYAQFSIDNGIIPVFSFYLAGSQMGGSVTTLFNNLASASYMNAYFTSFKLMLQKCGAFTGKPIIVHSEPDMWSFMQQQRSSDPAAITVAVASSGFADASGYPNNAKGLAQALVHMRDLYAVNVKIGLDHCLWSVNYEPTGADSPTSKGTQAAGFLNLLNANYDMLLYNTSDRDSAYKVIVLGQPVAQAWWTDTTFANVKSYMNTVNTAIGKKGLLWQTPIGNTLYRSCNNTAGHYQDNRPEYFLKSGNRQRIIDFVGAGIIGVLFGEGLGAGDVSTTHIQTSYYDQMNDGTTNPAPVAGGGNSLVASFPDDDGGFLRTAAAAYYQNPVALPATPPPAVPVNTVIPAITGTPQAGQTLTASTGTWTNSPTSYAYQWKRAGASISGATASTYVPATADVGFTLTVSVTATNAAGSSVPASSNPTSSVIAASSLIFPASTTNRALIAQASMPVPAYLVATTDTSLGNKIMRISDSATFGGSQPTGVGSIQMIRHHYAKDQVWNADESKILLGKAKYPGALVHGTTYAYLSSPANLGFGNERLWSNIDPNIMYGTAPSPARLLKYNVATDVVTTIATFSAYSNIRLGMDEGNLSDDDRYACMAGVSGTSLVVFVYDLVGNVVVGSRTFANTTLSNNINFASMTPSGTFVAVMFNTTALGFPAGSLQLYDRNMNYLRQIRSYVGHIDFGYDMAGNEVAVGNTTDSDVFHQFVFSIPLATGVQRIELPVGSLNNPTHVSCRNVKRPGWAYFSEAANTDSTHPVTYYNQHFNYNEIFAIKLDGTGTIERWAKEHHVTDPSFDRNTNDAANRAAMAVPSRNGDRILFASDWGDVATTAFIHSYVAWWT